MGEVTYSEDEPEGIMSQDHDAIVELLPAYALGALDDTEARRVEVHLRECSLCQEMYRSYLETAHLMAYAVPVYDPPARLRESIRLLTLPSSTTREETPASERRTSASPNRFLSSPRPLAMLLIVVSLVTAGLAGWNVRLSGKLAAMESEMTDAHELAEILMDYMEAPDAYDTEPVYSTNGDVQARGMVLRERNGKRIILVAEGLPPLNDGHMYQVWLYDRLGKAIPVREFRCDEKGRAVVIFESPIAPDNVMEIGVMLKPGDNASPDLFKPILDGQFRSDEGLPLMLAAAAL